MMLARTTFVFALLVVTAASHAAVSQQPLLHRATTSDKPNLVFTMDDSSSMAERYLPESISAFSDVRRWQQGFHPGDAPGASMRSNVIAPPMTYTTRAGDVWSARMRSSGVNRLYYDPSVRYLPWARADGTLLPAADPSAAALDPLVAGSAILGTAVDLRGEQVAAASSLWCRSDPNPAVDPATGPLCSAIGERFAPATYYSWNGGSSYAPGSFTRVRIMDSASFLQAATRTDCSPVAGGATCTQDQEYRNFANWFVYHRTRLYAAIGAISRTLSVQEDVFRLGYGRTGQSTLLPIDGQTSLTLMRGVRHFSGTERTDFFDWLHRLGAASESPVRRAVDDVGRYFERAQASDSGSPWAETPWLTTPSAHSPCRRSYHLLVTDGGGSGVAATTAAARSNIDGNSGALITHADGVQTWRYLASAPWRDQTAGTLADVALHYYARDLHPGALNAVPARPDNELFWQAMVNLTVGFGAGGTLDPALDLPALVRGDKTWPAPVAGQPSAIDDVWHAALNSGGRHLSALDSAGLESALGSLLKDTRPLEVTTAGVALSGKTLDSSSRKYVAGYRTQDWAGDITAYAIADDGSSGAQLWNAAARLPAPALRNIWSWSTATRAPVQFNWTSLVRAGLAPSLGPTADSSLIDYLRGDRTNEGALFRRRASAIGDIVNSQPLYVKGQGDLQYNFLPASVPGRDTYRAFVRSKAARAGLVIFGANDGMLHALRETDGQELFAFVPSAVLPSLAQLARPQYQHRFFVDGPTVETDAWWNAAWHNLVLGSSGAGAPSVFAIDVTVPEALGASSPLWEYNVADDAELGHVLARPEAGLLRNGQWAAVFGNGFDSAAGLARLVILDLKTGRLIRSLQVGATSAAGSNGLGGVRLVRDATNVVVGAYAGDLLGNVWRFDLNSADPTQWKVAFNGAPLFTALDSAGLPRPITAPVEYVDHPQGGQLVLAGTGKLFEADDVTSTQVQSIYGLWDRAPATRDALSTERIQSQSLLAVHTLGTVSVAQVGGAAGQVTYDTLSASPINWSTQRGWMLALPARMRDVHGPSFEKGFVRFSLVAPADVETHGCGATLPSGLDIQLKPLTGEMPPSAIFDTNGDGIVDPSDLRVAGVRTTGEAPGVVAIDSKSKGAVVGGAQRAVQVDYGAQKPVRNWRQIFNFPS